MKLGNIILGITLILLGLSSCSKETAIDELNEATSEVQIILSSVPAITKAGSSETEKPTDKELIIQNCVLGIYDQTDQKWVSTTFVSSLTEDETATDHKTYKVASNLKLVNNHEHTVMVIANVDEKNIDAYKACDSFEDFEAIKEGTEIYAFDASNLLKYGKIENFRVSSQNNRIEVPLDILAARIEFVINVKQTDVKFEETYYDMGEVELNIKKDSSYTPKKVLDAFNSAGYNDVVIFEDWNQVSTGKPSNGDLHYGDRPINIPQGNGVKGVYIPEYKAIQVDKFKGRTLEITNITVKNIRTQAIAILPSEENKMHNQSEYKAMSFDNETRKYTFYTYAKGKETDNPLEVLFSGKVKEQYILKRTPVVAEWFAFADSYNPRIWGSVGTEAIELTTGWSNATYVFFTVKNWKKDTSIELPDKNSGENNSIGDYSNSFLIKGEKSQMIEYGHLYNVTATITDFTPLSTGELRVDIQDYNTVKVPEFGFN